MRSEGRASAESAQRDDAAAQAERRTLRNWARLWYGALGGAVAWSLHLLASYAILPVACAAGSTLPIHALTLVFALATIGAGVASFASWRRAGATAAERWTGLASLVLNGIFLFAIIIEGLPAFALHPCS